MEQHEDDPGTDQEKPDPTLSDLCQAITIKIRPVDEDPASLAFREIVPGSHCYRIRLTYEGRTMIVPFVTGPAWTRDPVCPEVMEALLSDAASVEQAPDFLTWCRDLGADPDSRKAEQCYRTCQSIRRRLQFLLGAAYQQFLQANR